MPVASLFSGSKCYFFAGDQYIRVTRGDTGPGTVDAGYPKPISNWGWGNFGRFGIDAALYSRSKCYFFAGNQYIRVTRGDTGPGTVDAGYPAPISNWGWGNFGADGIDAALFSGTKCYFFAGDEYIRVTRGDTGAGTVDAGYPRSISNWGWGNFGRFGIDSALYSRSKCYFFAGDQYIRVTRGDTGPGTVDAGYPRSISHWNWPAAFRNLWGRIGGNFSFANGISGGQRVTLLERHQFAFSRIQACGNLSNSEQAALAAAYRRPIRHGIETRPNVNASATVNGNRLWVNFNVLFPQGNDEIAQTLIHEMMHCAGFSHPTRRDAPAGMSCAAPNPAIFDCPFDNGQYYGTPPLRAEICIAGNQSDALLRLEEKTADESCVIENGIATLRIR